MGETISHLLILAGAVFMFLGSLGVLRMPDLFLRMHASTKSSTLGIILLMSGIVIYFSDLTVTARAFAVVFFVFITIPLSAQLVGRAAYNSGEPLWKGTLSDALSQYYSAQAPPRTEND